MDSPDSPPAIKYEPEEIPALDDGIMNNPDPTVKAEPADHTPLLSSSLPTQEAPVKADPATTALPMSDIREADSDPKPEPGRATDDGDSTTVERVHQETEYLQKLIQNQVPEILETGVGLAVDILDQVKVPLEKFGQGGVQVWLETIKELKGRAKPPRTVVGVVGNTGAGKSSVINALLDEER